MTTFLRHSSRYAIFVLVFAIFAGCATTSRQPWVENGQRIGTIWRKKAEFGVECEYINNAWQLQRTEKRNQNDTLLPGASVTRYAYDSDGNLIEERNFDAQDSPTACGEGYVVKKYAYSTNEANDRVAVQSFFGRDNKPTCTTNGYAVARIVHEGSTDEVKEVVLENEQNQPASGLWEGVTGVARVKYLIVEGVGSVRCGIYYGPDGKIVGRNVVKGTTAISRTN